LFWGGGKKERLKYAITAAKEFFIYYKSLGDSSFPLVAQIDPQTITFFDTPGIKTEIESTLPAW
jgi:hypothetical protein